MNLEEVNAGGDRLLGSASRCSCQVPVPVLSRVGDDSPLPSWFSVAQTERGWGRLTLSLLLWPEDRLACVWPRHRWGQDTPSQPRAHVSSVFTGLCPGGPSALRLGSRVQLGTARPAQGSSWFTNPLTSRRPQMDRVVWQEAGAATALGGAKSVLFPPGTLQARRQAPEASAQRGPRECDWGKARGTDC